MIQNISSNIVFQGPVIIATFIFKAQGDAKNKPTLKKKY